MTDDLIKRLRDEVAQHEPRCLLLSPETVIMLLDEIERLRIALHGISLGAQNSMTSKEGLGREARAAMEPTK